MVKFSINNLKSMPQSAGHKRSRPLSSVARLPSLSTLVISEQDTSSSSKGKIFLTPRKAEFRKGWGNFKSRQRYASLVSLDGNSTVSSTASHSASLFSTSYDDASASTGGSGSHLSLCSSISSTPSSPLTTMSENNSDTTVSLDAWGFFADI
eukprot:CAMPEP_0181064618 /NCGR_PEP_ID=MMETSP1070-20121207/24292_1 /TAXON_ID=265543 /ORGANISM="Minutocellus polymorphus, Strain NH13" /LENGTH=151 /DNA_ID=CAMNT_0023144935 /DNA_START=105 /DNA_END=560 /DNA_ORIENTATION=-